MSEHSPAFAPPHPTGVPPPPDPRLRKKPEQSTPRGRVVVRPPYTTPLPGWGRLPQSHGHWSVHMSLAHSGPPSASRGLGSLTGDARGPHRRAAAHRGDAGALGAAAVAEVGAGRGGGVGGGCLAASVWDPGDRHHHKTTPLGGRVRGGGGNCWAESEGGDPSRWVHTLEGGGTRVTNL